MSILKMPLKTSVQHLIIVAFVSLFTLTNSRAEQVHIFDLITQLGAAKWEERSAAAIALGKRKDKVVLVPLSEALRDESS